MAETTPAHVHTILTRILTIKDCGDVVSELFEASGKWWWIGMRLRLEQRQLGSIKKDKDEDCLREMIVKWLKKRSLKPSWQSLLDALNHHTVDEEGLAADIEKKLKAKEEETTGATPQDPLPLTEEAPAADCETTAVEEDPTDREGAADGGLEGTAGGKDTAGVKETVADGENTTEGKAAKKKEALTVERMEVAELESMESGLQDTGQAQDPVTSQRHGSQLPNLGTNGTSVSEPSSGSSQAHSLGHSPPQKRPKLKDNDDQAVSQKHCSRHRKPLELFCEGCQDFVCDHCVMYRHKGHQCTPVSDILPDYRDEIKQQLQSAEEHLDTVDSALRGFDTRRSEIEDQKAEIQHQLHEQIDWLLQALQRRREELIAQLDQLTEKKLKSLADEREKVKKFQDQLSNWQKDANDILKTESAERILPWKKDAITQITEIGTNIGGAQLAPTEKTTLKLVADDLEHEWHNYGIVLDEDQTVDPTQCYVTEEASVTLQTVDTEGKEMPVPVTDISAELVPFADNATASNTATVACAVKRKDKGKYTVTYTPATRGRHQLHFKVGQTPIGCSPLPVMVRLPPKRLGNPVRTIGNFSSGPYGIAVGNGGRIYVTELNLNKIHILSREGQIHKSLDHVKGPWGICLDGDSNFFVAGYNDHQVHKFTPNGEHLQSVGSRGSGLLQFNGPSCIVYSVNDEKIYVSDSGNHRIQVFNKDLTLSSTFGTYGTANGQLNNPSGMAVDSTGNVYVAECGNNRIQVFTAQGQFIRAFGTPGNGPGQLSGPRDIYIDDTDTAYVAEMLNGRVSVFTIEGEFLASFGQGHLNSPFGLTMDEGGFIAVANTSKREVLIF